MPIQELVLIIFYLVILIYSIILHEVAHGYGALFLGDQTAKYSGRLTLNPLKHIDPWGSIWVPLIMLFVTGFRFAFGWAKPVPFNPYNLKNQKWGPAMVAMSGPGSNILVALAAAIIARLVTIPSSVKILIANSIKEADWEQIATIINGSAGSILFTLLAIIITWNVILAFFNLIPIPPLDGSKLLFTIFPVKTETLIFFEQFGFIILFLIIFFFSGMLGFFLNWVLNIFFGIAV